MDRLTDPPKGTERLVIDAAAAMKTKHVFELVKMADVIVVPVLASAFDQSTTAAFLNKLNELKSIRKSKKPVAVVRNRVRPRTHAAARLARFLHEIEHQDLGSLTDRTIYNDVAAVGLSIFDLPGKRAETSRQDWAAVLEYVGAERMNSRACAQKCCQPVRSRWTSAPVLFDHPKPRWLDVGRCR